MKSKGFVTISFLSFGMGALLAFVFNVDSDNVTILSAASIAGVLSYMSIYFSEENKRNENVLNQIREFSWLYLKKV